MTDDSRTFENRADIPIGKTVRERREAISMTQAKLGGALGVTFQQEQKYEKGANRIAASKLLLIAEAPSCDVSELYGEDIADLSGAANLVRSWSKVCPEQREAISHMIATLV